MLIVSYCSLFIYLRQRPLGRQLLGSVELLPCRRSGKRREKDWTKSARDANRKKDLAIFLTNGKFLTSLCEMWIPCMGKASQWEEKLNHSTLSWKRGYPRLRLRVKVFHQSVHKRILIRGISISFPLNSTRSQFMRKHNCRDAAKDHQQNSDKLLRQHMALDDLSAPAWKPQNDESESRTSGWTHFTRSFLEELVETLCSDCIIWQILAKLKIPAVWISPNINGSCHLSLSKIVVSHWGGPNRQCLMLRSEPRMPHFSWHMESAVPVARFYMCTMLTYTFFNSHTSLINNRLIKLTGLRRTTRGICSSSQSQKRSLDLKQVSTRESRKNM